VVIALFDNLGTFELVLCGIAGLLVFGRRLPEVASQAGATLAKFKRSLDGAVQDSGVEEELRKIKQALPTDVSMRDVARAAARKMEDRMRELNDATELDVKNAIEQPVTPASPTTPNAATPDQTTSESTSSQSAQTQSSASSSTPDNTATPHRTEGVDPARHFGPPGSIPRD